ncbi:hypothetical protein D3C71_1306970 [compost metagenome]
MESAQLLSVRKHARVGIACEVFAVVADGCVGVRQKYAQELQGDEVDGIDLVTHGRIGHHQRIDDAYDVAGFRDQGRKALVIDVSPVVVVEWDGGVFAQDMIQVIDEFVMQFLATDDW